MFEIIIICIVFYLGYQFGCSVTYFRLSRIFHQLANSLGVNLEQELNKLHNIQQRKQVSDIAYQAYHLETEVHGDMIYLFDKERNDFICQAKSLDELAKLAKEIKKIDDAVVTHGDKVFMFHNGKLIEKS